MALQRLEQITMILVGLNDIGRATNAVEVVHVQVKADFPIRLIDEGIVRKVAQGHVKLAVIFDVRTYIRIIPFFLLCHNDGHPLCDLFQCIVPLRGYSAIDCFYALDLEELTHGYGIEDRIPGRFPQHTHTPRFDEDEALVFKPLDCLAYWHGTDVEFFGNRLDIESLSIADISIDDLATKVLVYLLTEASCLDNIFSTFHLHSFHANSFYIIVQHFSILCSNISHQKYQIMLEIASDSFP